MLAIKPSAVERRLNGGVHAAGGSDCVVDCFVDSDCDQTEAPLTIARKPSR
ncbi:hypothetical protein APY04_0867 [Hyphomicrobium sulfonivorans]|uniref:Uncharacterized protein n=1 Tax=Hyphomicrobium sulfonivorans TaxID=121290 RepID=A0A120CX91_HYPSL|nr:hypothetical protein APY04_0867 [Hyphomicrobium sulfonivorans]